ncbi:hypothetical protein MP228_001650 [Amoeboaphelidium protococcarum]|nr:hypothetical protein MP228_001650 [Amoeboaphelidium protococcarum]
MDRKVVINKIDVEGVEYTKKTVLQMYFDPIMEMQNQPFRDVFKETHVQLDKLTKLGIFQSVDVVFNYPEDDKYLNVSERDRDSVPMEIKLTLRERPRIHIKSGTEFDRNEADVNIQGVLRNALGGGEFVSVSASRGTLTNFSFELQARKPLHSLRESSLEVVAYKKSHDYSQSSAFHQVDTAVGCKWNFMTKYGYHTASLFNHFREMTNIHADASMYVREQAKLSNKLSAQFEFVRDERNDLFIPSEGKLLKVVNELSLLQGTDGFMKSTALFQYCKQISENVVINASLSGGFISLFGGSMSNSQLPIYDRFFLGGPSDIRGFSMRGIGCKAHTLSSSQETGIKSSDQLQQKYNSIGGNSYWAAGLSVYSALPYLKEWNNLKSHSFVNVGSLYQAMTMQNSVQTIKETPIAGSVGWGLLFRAPMCRLEVNLAFPFMKSHLDKESHSYFKWMERGPKLQIGVGMDFL